MTENENSIRNFKSFEITFLFIKKKSAYII